VQGLAVAKRQAAAGALDRLREHRCPRGIEGALPGRILRMRNVGTPRGSGPGGAHPQPGRPTVREAEFPGGNRKAREANAGVPKGGRNPGRGGWPSGRLSRITGRIRGPECPGPEGR
jgi:hypothetical protein